MADTLSKDNLRLIYADLKSLDLPFKIKLHDSTLEPHFAANDEEFESIINSITDNARDIMFEIKGRCPDMCNIIGRHFPPNMGFYANRYNLNGEHYLIAAFDWYCLSNDSRVIMPGDAREKQPYCIASESLFNKGIGEAILRHSFNLDKAGSAWNSMSIPTYRCEIDDPLKAHAEIIEAQRLANEENTLRSHITFKDIYLGNSIALALRDTSCITNITIKNCEFEKGFIDHLSNIQSLEYVGDDISQMNIALIVLSLGHIFIQSDKPVTDILEALNLSTNLESFESTLYISSVDDEEKLCKVLEWHSTLKKVKVKISSRKVGKQLLKADRKIKGWKKYYIHKEVALYLKE